MALKSPNPKLHNTGADTTKAVDEFMGKLDHAFKAEIQEIRLAILSADLAISEGIKWNSPSYRTTEYFATTNLREKTGIGVILHLGAKVRDVNPDGLPINDSDGLLKWLAKDRASIVFRDMNDFCIKKGAFISIIQQWVAYV
jgi:hypothetical protein